MFRIRHYLKINMKLFDKHSSTLIFNNAKLYERVQYSNTKRQLLLRSFGGALHMTPSSLTGCEERYLLCRRPIVGTLSNL